MCWFGMFYVFLLKIVESIEDLINHMVLILKVVQDIWEFRWHLETQRSKVAIPTYIHTHSEIPF